MKLVGCYKTDCQSNTSHICCGTPCRNGLDMLDEVIKLAHEYIEERDMEYVHAIWEAAEKLDCVEILKKSLGV